LEVLDGQTFKSLSLISQRLGYQTVHGFDALDEESILVHFATKDSDNIDVLK
jgi:hypothetical protein